MIKDSICVYKLEEEDKYLVSKSGKLPPSKWMPLIISAYPDVALGEYTQERLLEEIANSHSSHEIAIQRLERLEEAITGKVVDHDDLYVKMDPVKREKVKVSIKRVRRGKPNLVNP